MIRKRMFDSRPMLMWLSICFFIITEFLLLYHIPRSSFIAMYGSFLLLFALYFYMLYNGVVFPLKGLIGLAIFLRFLALFNLPALSDDYLRFIWDGKMTMATVGPYRFTPGEYLALHPDDPYLQQLYAAMNSPGYHTIYPAIMQYVFFIAVKLFPTNIYGAAVIMKIFIFIAECISLRLLWLLTKLKNIPAINMMWYGLNPLVIIELTGNIHFEGLMFCFLLACYYLLHKNKWLPAAICWALAVATKIMPLMLAPLIFRYLGVKKFILFVTCAGMVIAALMLPFYNRYFTEDFGASFRLFYHLFEFNASIFYVVRYIGYLFVNYDIIEETAPILGIITFLLVLLISWWPSHKFSLEKKSIWIFSLYFLFATMVHPWYATILVLLTVFTDYRFPVIFSVLIPLSYFPYSLKIYDENMNVIFIEYAILFLFLLTERYYKRKGKPLFIVGR